MAVMLVLGGLADLDERGIRHEESFAIARANLVDFSFGDSIHCHLCHAIVVNKVEPQPQTHIPAFGVIPGYVQAQRQDNECRVPSGVECLRGLLI